MRSQVDFALARRAVLLFKHAAPVPPSLSCSSPLEPVHDLGRLGCLLAEMRAMVRRTFYGSLALWSADAVRVRVLVSCRCDSMVACGTSNACPRQPYGASPWSLAVRMRSCGAARDGVRHVWRFARLVERGRPRSAFVACGSCTALRNAWDRSGQNFGPVRTHEVILGVLDTPDICYKRW